MGEKRGMQEADVVSGVFKCQYSRPHLTNQLSIVSKLDALSDETKKLETIYKQKLDDLDELKKIGAAEGV